MSEIGELANFQIFTMAAISLAKNLQVEHFCNLVTNTVRSMPLNYSIQETPFSIYVTVRKSLSKNASDIVNMKSESTDEKIKKLERVNQSLIDNLEEAVLESEEKSNTILELKEKVDILLEKLEVSDQIRDKINAVNALKDSEIEALTAGNKKLTTENKALKVDLEKVSEELNFERIEYKDYVNKFEREKDVLIDNLITKKIEAKVAVEKLEKSCINTKSSTTDTASMDSIDVNSNSLDLTIMNLPSLEANKLGHSSIMETPLQLTANNSAVSSRVLTTPKNSTTRGSTFKVITANDSSCLDSTPKELVSTDTTNVNSRRSLFPQWTCEVCSENIPWGQTWQQAVHLKKHRDELKD